MVNELLQSSLFSNTSLDTLNDISAFCKRMECDDGDILIRENSTENYDLFILCEGSVEVLSNSSDGANSEVVISSNEKNLLGEISWLLKMNRTATVRCNGEAVIIRIDGDKLMAYFEINKEAGYYFMKRIALLLAQRISQTDILLKQMLWNE